MLSYLLDNAIRIPGTRFRIGYDALIGLLPGVGDAAGLVLSAYIVWEAARLGAPVPTLLRMGGNVALETLVGAVPLLGDVFDAAWKANARNMHLLHEHLGLQARGRKPSSRRALFVLGIGLLLVLVLVGFLVYGIFAGLVHLAEGVLGSGF